MKAFSSKSERKKQSPCFARAGGLLLLDDH
jgi:hypothetical protein